MAQIMERVTVPATLESLEDIFAMKKGVLPPDRVRRVEVKDALVDTGATMLLMPKRHIAELGLQQFRSRPSRTLSGHLALPIYSSVRLTVLGRDCTVDVGEIGDDYPVIIGQVPLELLDWVVDCKNQRLIGNPEHGGEAMIDLF